MKPIRVTSKEQIDGIIASHPPSQEWRLDASIEHVPLKDHPKFSKPCIRFRHAAKRPKLMQALEGAKSAGIETIMRPVYTLRKVKS